MDELRRFVGIDVAKAALDVFIGSAGGPFQWLMMSSCSVSTDPYRDAGECDDPCDWLSRASTEACCQNLRRMILRYADSGDPADQ